jgi:hypothetical protein
MPAIRGCCQAASRGHFRELMASTSRSPELPAGATESARWGPGRATAEQLEAHVALLELLSLDPSLQRRLQLEVAARLADVAAQPTDPGAPQAAAVLEAATVGRLVPVVRRWSEGGVIDVAIGTPAGVSVGARGAITVTVGVRWVADIWGRYLAAVGGFLVLEVHRIVEDRAEITGWASPAGDPARLLLRGPAPWRVVERLER